MRVDTVIVFMACSKAYIWALPMLSADTKGHGPACVLRPFRAHARWRDSSPWASISSGGE